MASSVVVYATSAEAAPTGGINITYMVAFAKDNNTTDVDLVTVNIAPGDTPNAINSKIATGVRDRAAALGYAIPANGISIPSYSKG